MDFDPGERLTVRIELMSAPCLWYWEIIDTEDGALVESSWATEWTGYESSPEAWRAGMLRLTELTRPGRRAVLPGRRPPIGGGIISSAEAGRVDSKRRRS